MKQSTQFKPRPVSLKDVFWGFLSAAVSLFGGAWLVGGFSRPLNEPWVRQGDVVSVYAQIFGLKNFGNSKIIPSHGWPFQMDISTFFTTDWITEGLYRALLLFFEPFAALHMYLILGFPVISILTYIAWRSLNFSPTVAAITAIALSLAPWHLQRALIHPNYALYITAPLLIIFIVLYIRWQKRKLNSTFIQLMLILVVISISAEYFWVFSVIFIITLVIYYYLYYKNVNRKEIFANFVLILVIPLSALINLIYQKQLSIYPTLSNTVERSFNQVELYSGSFISLFLPSPLTAVPLLSDLRVTFDNNSLYVNNENHPWNSLFISSLIIIALATILHLAFSRKSNLSENVANMELNNIFIIKLFALLFFVALLFYWTTGLGSIFGFFISDWMRSWGRMYIFLAYFAAVVSMLVLRYFKVISRMHRQVRLIAFILISLIIFVDQLLFQIPVEANVKENYTEVKNFSADLNKKLEPNCPILQVPVFPFPEAGYNLNTFTDYEHFWLPIVDNSRPYSYGANKATQQFLWQKNLDQENLQKLSLQAAAVGYCAIVVDLSSFESRVEEGNRWIKALGAPLAVSESARWAAWNVEENFSQNQLRELISLNWFGTFAAGEVQNEVQIDFYEEDFNLYALNPTQEKIVGEVSFKALSGTCTPSQSVKVTDSSSGTVLLNSEVNKEPKLLSFKIELEPREQKRIDFELSSRICTVEWWSDTKVAFREQEFKLS